MKFKKGDIILCISENSVWTFDGYTEKGKVLLKEQQFFLSNSNERPSYPQEIFRKLTKLEKALK